MVYFIVVLLLVSSSSVFVNADLILGLLFVLSFYLIYSFGSSLIVNVLNFKIEKIFKRFYTIFFLNTSGLRNLITLIEKNLIVLRKVLVLNFSLAEVLNLSQSNNLIAWNKWSLVNYILWIKNWINYNKVAIYQKSSYNAYIATRLINLIFVNDGTFVKIQAYKVPLRVWLNK